MIVDPIDCGKAILVGIKDGGLLLFDTIHKKEYDKPWDIEYIKPYLRPMSSMTAEEYKEYDSKRSHICDEYNRYCFETVESIDWLLEHHFDYRGLIEKGLALEALEGMYNIKEK